MVSTSVGYTIQKKVGRLITLRTNLICSFPAAIVSCAYFYKYNDSFTDRKIKGHSLQQTNATPSEPTTNGHVDHSSEANGLPSQSPSTLQNGTNVPEHHEQHHHLHRPHLHKGASSEQMASPTPQQEKELKTPKEQKPVTPGSPGRRNSWMSSLSSKFSSGTTLSTPAPVVTPSTPTKGASSPPHEHMNPFGAAVGPSTVDKEKQDEKVSASPPTKISSPGFLSSAFRRLSSSNNNTMGKAANSGAVCPRKVMNVDPYRERCEIPDLEQSKLRRVSFCVDVEIAAAPVYNEPEPEPPTPGQTSRRSSLSNENRGDNKSEKKKKDKKLKMSEGAALKNPKAVISEKDDVAIGKGKGELESDSPQSTPANDDGTSDPSKDPSRKKEKKKRSEEERKERKERKRAQSIENGERPAELTSSPPESAASAVGSPPKDTPPSKSTDRPTTDPLRIYKRCCQLRETPILKRITEQLSSPSACPVAEPGVVSILDLSGYWMQLPDIITLSDYLAVVPVKKLIMEDCGLGDEAVRLLLAGLLAVKTPDQAKHNRKLARRNHDKVEGKAEQLGVIHKLSLKNNTKISKVGWRHICLFIYMSRTLKAIDVSMIPIPKPPVSRQPTEGPHSPTGQSSLGHDIAALLAKSIFGRLGGPQLEELVMGECQMTTSCVEQLVDAVMQCGITRLGLANNGIAGESLECVLRFLRSGKCQGLDLGGNDLSEHIPALNAALNAQNPLYALSLADCNLSPQSLEDLLPALVQLPNFLFVDLSHNRKLFETKPSALNLLRKYLPQLPRMKRIHLLDVAMRPDHAIALAEVLPEIKTLAHLNILENHLLSPLADAQDESTQEEACALYASLMAAVRVSNTIVCIDIDVPSKTSSEVVKALAKQVVAYSLRNMERIPVSEPTDSAIAAITDPHGGENEFGAQMTVPDILLQLVGHMDDVPGNHDNDEPAPDDDYIVGGTGVVKALGVCLNRASDLKKASKDISPADSGAATPRPVLQGDEVNKGKAKEMSKNLLGSARKIRARLQPALVKEAKSGNEMNFSTLLLLRLLSAINRMIQVLTHYSSLHQENSSSSTPPFAA